VCVRFRPVNEKEQLEAEKNPESADPCVSHLKGEDGSATIQVKHPDRRKPMDFTLDDCFWTQTSQQEMFYSVAMLTCKDILRGYNGTLFCYGQTGSGKTFTMYGPEGAKAPPKRLGAMERRKQMEQLGIVPRAMGYLFYELSKNNNNESFSVKVTCVEIYLNRLRDLLRVAPVGRRKKRGVLGEDLGPRLKVRQLPNGSTYCENARVVEAANVREFLEIMNKANTNRTVSSTQMNRTSSRSHSILQIFVEQKRRDGSTLKSKLNFVDLAGSEKVRKSEAKGQRLKEAMKINQTLMELGLVIKDLSKGASFISYRNTDLTFLLKDSLGGNTKTTLIVCASPHLWNITETISTLQFGTRCKLVKNQVRKNKDISPDEMRALIKQLRLENRELKARLTSMASGFPASQPANATSTSRTRAISGAGRVERSEISARLTSALAISGGVSPTSAKPTAKGKPWDNSWPKWIDEVSNADVIPKEVYVEELHHQRAIAEEIIAELDATKVETQDFKKKLATEMDSHQALQLEFAQMGDRHKAAVCKMEIENAELKAEMEDIQKMLQLERENRDLSHAVNVASSNKRGKKSRTKLQRNVAGHIKLTEQVSDSPTTAKLKQVQDRRMQQFSDNLTSTNVALEKQHNALKTKNTTIMDLMRKLTKIEKSRTSYRNQISDYMEMVKRKDDQLIEYDNNKMNLEGKIEALQLQIEKQAQELDKVKGANQLKRKLGVSSKKKNAALDSMLEEQEKFLTEMAPDGEEFEAVLLKEATSVGGEDSKLHKKRMAAVERLSATESESRQDFQRMIKTHGLTRYATEQSDSEDGTVLDFGRTLDDAKEADPAAVALQGSDSRPPVAQWGPYAVGDWLRSVKLGMYAESFLENEVDGHLLTTTEFDPQMLRNELGVKSLHAQKLIKEINLLKRQ